MARSFNGTSDFLSNSTLKNVFGGASSATIAGWVNRSAAGRALTFGFTGPSAATTYTCHVLWYPNDNKLYAIFFNNPNTSYGYTSGNTATGWTHVAMVFDGTQTGNSNRLRLYLNGVMQSLTFVGTVPSTIAPAANLSDFRIGRDVHNSIYSNGSHAETAAWIAALTADEVAALAKGFSPRLVRPTALASYLPLIRDVVDLKGNAWTTTGTTVTPHPHRIG